MSQQDRKLELIRSAGDLFEAGRFQAAEKILDGILAADPRLCEALHLAGLVADKKGRQDLAVKYISTAIESGACSPLMCFNLGVILQKMGHLKEAESQFQQALALAQDFEPALEWLSRVQSKTGNFIGAIASLERFTSRRPDARIFHGIGVLYTSIGNSRAAVDAYKRALALEPERPDTLNNLGLILNGSGKADQAEDCFLKAVAANPRYRTAMINLGLMYKLKNRLREAERWFWKATTADPDYPPAFNYLGQVMRLKGDLDTSIAAHQRAIRLILSNPIPPVPPRKTLDVGTAHPVLKETKDKLDRAGIPFFLCAGSLLGIIRDGDLLPHDKDLDLGLPWGVDRAKLVAVMTTDRRFAQSRSQNGQPSIVPDKETFMITFVHIPTRIIVDMFFFKPDGDHFLCGFNHFPFPVLSRPGRFELVRMDWLGVEWAIPSNPERYLEDMYGPDWRILDSCFDTIVSSFCMTEESRLIRRCFGYERLFSNLRSGQGSKAAGYCKQLLRLQKDPFISELQRKLW